MPSDLQTSAMLVVAEVLITMGKTQALILMVAPLWLTLYLAVRSLSEGRPSRLLAWARGVLAWGIVATHACFSARYAPIARWRLFWGLNKVVVATLAFALRPDLAGPIALFVALWLGTQGLIFVARQSYRASKAA